MYSKLCSSASSIYALYINEQEFWLVVKATCESIKFCALFCIGTCKSIFFVLLYADKTYYLIFASFNFKFDPNLYSIILFTFAIKLTL